MAAAQGSWTDAAHLTQAQLVQHWLLQQQTLSRDIDARPLAKVTRLRFEDLAADPEGAPHVAMRMSMVHAHAHGACPCPWWCMRMCMWPEEQPVADQVRCGEGLLNHIPILS